MKTKLCLSLLGALFLSQAMMAQFHAGIKGGANIIKIDGESFKDQFRYGYHLGGFMIQPNYSPLRYWLRIWDFN